MFESFILIFTIVGLLALTFLTTGCSPVGKAMRQSPYLKDANGNQVPPPDELGKRSFIEASTANNTYSCSFVEFDGRGDFIQFAQHSHCWDKIREYAKGPGVILVMYIHGWKNNSQSSDVLRFNSFLSKLANTKKVQGSKMRVHGVYLSWRGNLLKPQIDLSDRNQELKTTKADFGDQFIIDPARSRRISYPGKLIEQVSYWNRKHGAEHKVSGIPINRAIFTYANAAQKTPNSRGVDNRVFLMGHSMGALMIEQSVLPGVVGSLMDHWNWDEDYGSSNTQGLSDVLPFDLVLLVNSAAPSIYAKEMSDFLSAHGRSQGKKAPIVVSLTSRADGATRKVHRVANVLSPFSPSNQRNYTKRVWDLGKDKRDQAHPDVHQSEFYKRTPGHNPFLVSRWIVPRQALLPELDGEPAFSANLNLRGTDYGFYLSGPTGSQASSWSLSTSSPDPSYVHKGASVVPWKTPYWVIRCEKEHISSHGDIWSKRAMEIYAALFRFSETY